MGEWSIVEHSNLGHGRIDAQFYQPTYLREEKALLALAETVEVMPLGALVSKRVRTGRTPRRREFKEGDQAVHFIKTDTLREGRIEFDRCDMIPARVISGSDYLKENEVLVTIIGATSNVVGRAAIYPPHSPEAIANQNIAIIRPDSRLDAYYLQAFLNSRFGRHQLWRYSRQTEQVNLNCLEVERTLVPIFGGSTQKRIADLVRESIDLRRRAENTLAKAEALLVEKLGVQDVDLSDRLTFVWSSTAASAAGRYDAEFFQPKYHPLLQLVESMGFDQLGNIGRLSKGIEVGKEAYEEAGVLFIRVSTLNQYGITEGDSEKYISSELYQELKSRFEPRLGELLITKDATPGIAYHLSEAVKGIISSGIVRLRLTSDIDPEYLTLVINSKVAQMQIERETSGAVILHWKPEQIERLKIPRLSPSAEQGLGDLVRESNRERAKAESLHQKARQRVERIILDQE